MQYKSVALGRRTSWLQQALFMVLVSCCIPIRLHFIYGSLEESWDQCKSNNILWVPKLSGAENVHCHCLCPEEPPKFLNPPNTFQFILVFLYCADYESLVNIWQKAGGAFWIRILVCSLNQGLLRWGSTPSRLSLMPPRHLPNPSPDLWYALLPGKGILDCDKSLISTSQYPVLSRNQIFGLLPYFPLMPHE